MPKKENPDDYHRAARCQSPMLDPIQDNEFDNVEDDNFIEN